MRALQALQREAAAAAAAASARAGGVLQRGLRASAAPLQVYDPAAEEAWEPRAREAHERPRASMPRAADMRSDTVTQPSAAMILGACGARAARARHETGPPHVPLHVS